MPADSTTSGENNEITILQVIVTNSVSFFYVQRIMLDQIRYPHKVAHKHYLYHNHWY